MKYFIILLFFVLSFSAGERFLYAQDASCIKGKYLGDASTYNPNLPGWKTGGQSLATGGRYNPNEFEAALQLDEAKKTGCGYGSGKICNAVVSTPAGLAAIVRINDNGPLVPGRIIDLNEKSMRYLSGGRYGNNSGVLKNVSVTLLCTVDSAFVGPVNEQDRQAWLAKTFGAPITDVRSSGGQGYVPASSGYGIQNANSFMGSGFQPGSPPFGQQQYPPASNNQRNYADPISYNPAGQTNPSTGPSTDRIPTNALPVAAILVQPVTVTRGRTLIVSWTSVNMAPNSCTVLMNGQQFDIGEQGTKPLRTVSSDLSTITFTLKCTDTTGIPKESSATATLQ